MLLINVNADPDVLEFKQGTEWNLTVWILTEKYWLFLPETHWTQQRDWFLLLKTLKYYFISTYVLYWQFHSWRLIILKENPTVQRLTIQNVAYNVFDTKLGIIVESGKISKDNLREFGERFSSADMIRELTGRLLKARDYFIEIWNNEI